MSSAEICLSDIRRMAPRHHRIRNAIVWGLSNLMIVSSAAPLGAQQDSSASPVVAQANGVDVFATSELLELNTLSQSLVDRARGGRADAVRFRIDAKLYRETLRRLMLDSYDTESVPPISTSLYLQMVRMAALLNAAAECKTGRYITCPVELMRQLDSQQKILNVSLEAYAEEAQ